MTTDDTGNGSPEFFASLMRMLNPNNFPHTQQQPFPFPLTGSFDFDGLMRKYREIQNDMMRSSLVEYGFGEYKLYLPKDEEEARKVWIKIKKIVDGILES